MLPVYWLKLSPADYGILGLCQVITVFISPLVALGLYDAVQRFYHEWQPAERPQKLAALWFASLLTGLVVCLILQYTSGPLISRLLTQLPFRPYVEITIWYAFAANLSLFPLTILRAQEELKHYTAVVVGSFATFTAITVTMVFVFDWGVMGYLVGSLTNSVVWGAYFIFFMFKQIKFRFYWDDLIEPLKYSFPTVPSAVLDGVNGAIDRVFLDKHVGLAAIGIYNLSNQIGSALNSFNQVMKASWVPLVFRVAAERADAPAVLGRLSLYYVAAMAIPALMIALLAKELIGLFGDLRYAGVYHLVPLFVLAYYLQAVGTAMGRGLDLAKRTIFTPVIPIIALTVFVLAIGALVPRYGVLGMAVAYCISTFVRIVVHIWLSVHFYPRPLHAARLVALFVIIGSAFVAGNQIASGTLLGDAILKLAIIGIAAALIFWMVLDREQGLAFVKGLVNRRANRDVV